MQRLCPLTHYHGSFEHDFQGRFGSEAPSYIFDNNAWEQHELETDVV